MPLRKRGLCGSPFGRPAATKDRHEGGPAFDGLWLFRNIVRVLLSDLSMGSDLDVSLPPASESPQA
jgi:hypothetical protein